MAVRAATAPMVVKVALALLARLALRQAPMVRSAATAELAELAAAEAAAVPRVRHGAQVLLDRMVMAVMAAMAATAAEPAMVVLVQLAMLPIQMAVTGEAADY